MQITLQANFNNKSIDYNLVNPDIQDMLEAFKGFMLASGFVFNGEIVLLYDNEEITIKGDAE